MGSLSLVGLHKRYGALETLKSIDLSLADGEFLVLLGPSGCGKSTILNIIAGLIEPSSGDVRIGERSVIGLHPKNRDIAMVFQSYALYPNLTVARNIGFGLEMRGVARVDRDMAIAKVADTLQISKLLDRKPAELSGGQRQRVAIGRALVRNPAIFLFDEPLSNLDAKLRTEMRTEIKRLHQLLGTTMVYVTHDQIEAMTLATRIAVIKDGQIEQLGTPEEVYQRPASTFVASFVGSPGMNLLTANLNAGQLLIDGADAAISLPGTAANGPVIAGIRAETLRLAAAGEPAFSALVEVVELTGPEKLVVARVGDQKFLAGLPPDAQVVFGQTIRLAVDAEKTALFDPETERAIA
ncbi:multiple sugar transport system ATP-binding protein [Devosia sp. UYZn731]|uniref:ABC transporter ATP-binding protein n=1 Tax=Devosia sp. UYZn731 TaxID=3156345 RepID=UPI0033918D10